MTEAEFPDALPVGYRLHWYVLEHVLGQGGFGITYLARDTNLDRRVAIKEYLPGEIARRRSDATAHPRTEALAERYAWGLERFLLEARTLARFEHPNIVRVHSVFEANNSAYMVMRFEEGENLAALLERQGTLPETALLDFMVRILDGLQLVHATGFIHRDIKPENIYVRRDGSPVLLDFGSARRAFGSNKTVTILVAPGYAPLEQYYGDASTQGPWTDIYGLGATCYRAIAGHAPIDAIVRAKGVLGSAREVLPSAVEVGRGRYSEPLLKAIDHALQLSEQDRPQTVEAWRRELTGAPSPTTAPATVQALASVASVTAPLTQVARQRARTQLLWGGAAVLASLGVVGMYVLGGSVAAPAPQVASKAPPAAPPVPAAASEPPISTVLTAPAPAPTNDAKAPVPRAPDTIAQVRATPPRSAASKPVPDPAQLALAPPPAAKEPAVPSPVPAAPAPAVAAVPSAPAPPQRSARDEQLDAAEASLRRGDLAAAAEMVRPWAAAGVARAQTLLGRVLESRRGVERSDIEAYVYYNLAARRGDAAAQSLADKVGAKLQPAELGQAKDMIDHWRPSAEPVANPGR
jgi:hypothetical protein